jgi:hypothetical protein
VPCMSCTFWCVVGSGSSLLPWGWLFRGVGEGILASSHASISVHPLIEYADCGPHEARSGKAWREPHVEHHPVRSVSSAWVSLCVSEMRQNVQVGPGLQVLACWAGDSQTGASY